MTPFEAVYGTPPPSLLPYTPGTTRVQAVDVYLRDRETIIRELHRNLQLAQQRMKAHADQHRREVTFEVGDYVYLRLQPYCQQSVVKRLSPKLAPRFFGPFQILGKVGTVAYRLALPPSAQIHNVVHVSKLKRYFGPPPEHFTPLPPVADDSTILPQPVAVLDKRVIQKGKYRPKQEVLIQWAGGSTEDATWENAWRIARQYPHIILVDKDVSRGGE